MMSTCGDHRRGCTTTTSWLTLAVLVLAACGGGGSGDDVEADDSEPSETTEAAVETAQARDSAVAVADATVIAIVGDAGELNDSTLAVAGVVKAYVAEAVFTVGDNEYTTEGRTVAAYAESVGEVYGRWLDAGIFYPIPGDHDYGDGCDNESADADLDAYLEYFDLPSGPEDETYYDVRIGDIHVFALDTDGRRPVELQHLRRRRRARTWLARRFEERRRSDSGARRSVRLRRQ